MRWVCWWWGLCRCSVSDSIRGGPVGAVNRATLCELQWLECRSWTQKKYGVYAKHLKNILLGFLFKERLIVKVLAVSLHTFIVIHFVVWLWCLIYKWRERVGRKIHFLDNFSESWDGSVIFTNPNKSMTVWKFPHATGHSDYTSDFYCPQWYYTTDNISDYFPTCCLTWRPCFTCLLLKFDRIAQFGNLQELPSAADDESE